MSDKPLIPGQPWLTLIGIGEDGLAGLGEKAKQVIAAAPIVFGGARHLELAAALIKGEGRPWLSPFQRSVEEVLSRRGTAVVVLASGDPFLHGVGATLSRSVGADEMRVIPAPSAFSLAAARLGWPLQAVETISLHGRPIDLVRPLLHHGTRILALTSDQDGPAALAKLLAGSGFGRSRLTILEALGGADEHIATYSADAFSSNKINSLNLCAIDVVADQGARVLALAGGLDDTLFDHDGQITKREIRALTLSALAPCRGQLLWDIGAGSGSIGIEWMLADASMRAIAVEQSPARVERIHRNAASFGVPGLVVIEGQAPSALTDLPAPDAIFIGGGGSDAGVLDAAIDALRSAGRLVANAVTTEMEAILLAAHARLGGSLIRIDISRTAPIGGMTGWRPAMPVTQWCWTKP